MNFLGVRHIANEDNKGKISEWYDELLAKTDLVKVISAYVPLQKKGNTYWGCCPFHLEKTPSFSVSDSKQLYHCFGCKESGNALTFVKKMESVETIDAAKILAKDAGLEMPEFKFIKKDEGEFVQKRERLYALMREAAKHYHDNLISGKSPAASEYLKNRGVDKALAVKFGLGFSLNGSEIIEHLKALGYTEPEMKDAGLVENGANGYYDVFYDRLIIPIINGFKEVVAFGGRTLKPNPDFAKYRNSSQTLIFDKSKNIFGINLLKGKKLKDRKIEYIIMCEGYMDVIALHKAGFDTAVASMGTALTFSQAKQLKNYCSRIYISYDGDTAGQKATMRGLDILAEAGLSVRVVTLPEGLDPDDVIKKQGKDAYQKLLDEAKTLPAFKIDTLKNQYDFSDSEQKSKFAVEAVKVIKSLENPVEREDYIKIVQKLTNYSMSALLAQADITDVKPAAEPVIVIRPQSAQQNKTEKAKIFILAALANFCPYIDYSEDFVSLLADDFYAGLAQFFIICKTGGVNTVRSVYSRYGEEYKDKLNEILYYEFLAGDNAEKYKNCVTTLKMEALEKQKSRLVEEFSQTKNISLLKEVKNIDYKLKSLRDGTLDD